MVPPYSDKVSRAPPYLSLAQYHTVVFAYGAITHFGRPFQSRSANNCAITNRLLQFRSPLLSESRLISFPRATEMFQFARFASTDLCIQSGIPLTRWVSPFGHLRIKACLPAPRSFSQATTPFIACDRQGIHHVHLVTWSYNHKGYKNMLGLAFVSLFLLFGAVSTSLINYSSMNHINTAWELNKLIMQSQPVY